MNPTIVLSRLLCAMGTGIFATALVAQTPPAAPTPHGATAGDGPLRAIHAHVCGFHYYSGDLKRSVRADHYCSHLSDDLMQCVIYDSAKPDARLIGVEYIISEALFTSLPDEEKRLWHSHRYEVMSGLLVAPGLAGAEEQALMTRLVNSYGKTWHLWQVDRGDKLPLGLPKLMMGFTADGQADPAMVAARDRELGLDPARLKAQRASLPARPVAAGADGGPPGPAFQLSDDLLKPPQTAPRK